MKAAESFFFMGLLIAFVACTRSNTDVSINNEDDITSVVPNPYVMSTPDSMAFDESKEVKCEVNQLWYRHCGYGSAQTDSFYHAFLPSFFRFDTTKSSAHGVLELCTYGENGYPLTHLSFARFSLTPGIYFPVKNFFPTTDFNFTAN